MGDQRDQQTKRVALYLRVSSEDQVEKFGLDMQKEALEGLVKSKGKFEDQREKYVLAGEKYVYIEDGISGTVPIEERPAFARLLEDLDSSTKDTRPFDVVAVYKIDRLARKLKILLKVLDVLKDHNVELMSANESIDTSTAFGRAILGIVGVIAELEIETTKQRTEDGRNQAWQQGVVMGQHAEYGYAKNPDGKREVLEVEAKIVKRIFYEYVHLGKTAIAIAQDLEKDKVPSPSASAIANGKRAGKNTKKKTTIYFWRDDVIRGLLREEVYLGKYYFGKTYKNVRVPQSEWKLSPYRHTAIIDEITFSEAQRLLKISTERHQLSQKNEDDRVYLLSGLLRCDHCKTKDDSGRYNLRSWGGSKKEIGKSSGQYTYTYMCGRKNTVKVQVGCSVIPIPAKEIEEYVVGFVKNLLKDPTAVFEYQLNQKSTKLYIEHLDAKLKSLREQFNGIPNLIFNLREQHKHGHIKTIQELDREVDAAQSRATNLEEQINKLTAEKTLKEMPSHYIRTLEEFSNRYGNSMDAIYSDRVKMASLLRHLISEIVIYSRPMGENDSIAGRKVTRQRYIPESIQIEMHLPHQILTHLFENPDLKEEFGVKPVDL